MVRLGHLITGFLIILLFGGVLPTQNPNMITTQMEVNGIKYDAICDGGKEVTHEIKLMSEVKGTPTRLKIRQDKEGQHIGQDAVFDLNTISNILGRPRDTTFVDPHHTSFRCIDGRYDQPSLFTLGGDTGEFFLGLVVYEELLHVELTASQIDRLLKAYMDQMDHGQLHWGTDDNAIQHIEAEIGAYDGIDIQNPRQDLQDQIITIISDPLNIGDSHFKALLNLYEKLNLRRELVITFIQVFYRILWDKRSEYSLKINLQQLVGSHQEQAFIDVRHDKNGNAPLLASLHRTEHVSVFFNHQEAVRARRSQIALFFTTQLKHAGQDFDSNVLEHRLNNHALAFLEITGSTVAQHLPFYTILYE